MNGAEDDGGICEVTTEYVVESETNGSGDPKEEVAMSCQRKYGRNRRRTYDTTTTANGGVQTIITSPTSMTTSASISVRARPNLLCSASMINADAMKPKALETKMSDTIAYPIEYDFSMDGMRAPGAVPSQYVNKFKGSVMKS